MNRCLKGGPFSVRSNTYIFRLSGFCLAFLSACVSTPAEVRTWEDRQGNRYEAEFAGELFDKVTLKEPNGREHRIAVVDLSEHDQKYIRVMVPPVMDIDFTKKTRTKLKPVEVSDDDSDTVTILSATVTLRKISQRPFTSRLNAEVYFIAQEVDGDNYILLDRAESDFLFTQQDVHEFKTKDIEVTIYTEYTHQRRGENYLGYLVVISDAQNNIVQVKTDIDWLAGNAEKLRKLYARGAVSRYLRHFDRTMQQTEVPRPAYYESRAN